MNIQRGDIVLVELNEESVGSEQSGTRPAVVIQNDKGNKFSKTTIVAFLTTSVSKAKIPTHVKISKEEIESNDDRIKKDNLVLCEQIRTISIQRIIGIRGRVKETTLHKIDYALKISLGLK